MPLEPWRLYRNWALPRNSEDPLNYSQTSAWHDYIFVLEKSLLSLASHMRTCDSVFIFVFYICLSVFANWDFARDCVKFLDQFGSIAILTNYMF